MHFPVFAHQTIEQTQAVGRAGRAGHGYRNAFRAAHCNASASLPCRPPKPPLLMITTWVPGLAWLFTRSMMPSSDSLTIDGTVHNAAMAPRSQPRLAGAYQTTWSASFTLSGRPSRWAPSFMELERGSIMAMIGASPTRLRRPSRVVAIAVG